MDEQFDSLQESNLHERVNKLKDEGYRGFNVKAGKEKAFGIEVTVVDKNGKQLTAEGETHDEAYENVIERIDYLLDD